MKETRKAEPFNVRIVFLDFDGVIINADSFLPENYRKGERLRPTEEMVSRLNSLFDNVASFVVVSSSWKMLMEKEDLQDLFNEWGVKAHILDVTPQAPPWDHLSPAQRRGAEIFLWLMSADRPIHGFVILDDDGNMGALEPWHVKTDSAVGLTDESVVEAVKILTAGP